MDPSASPPPPDPIDRVAPTRRPDRRAVMYQLWRSLLFLHWEVPPDDLRRQLPPGLDLDLYQGRAYVGLIPFTMKGIRPVGLPAIPGLSSSHETNLRTYVHVEGRDPGVWFFSLDASNPVAVLVARYLLHLPYQRARMSLSRDATGALHYHSRRVWPGPVPADHDIRARPAGSPAPAPLGTLDYFLLERYLLYTVHRDRLIQDQVHHSPYPVQTAEILELNENLLHAEGLSRPFESPLVHFAAGVDVEIFPPRTLAAS